MKINSRIRRRAVELLDELERSEGLQVVLIPAPEPKHVGHKIRVCQSQNPPWFRRFTRQFTAAYGREKRARPKLIDRRRIPNALRRIAAGRPEGVYCERLIEFIRREIGGTRKYPAGYFDDIPF